MADFTLNSQDGTRLNGCVFEPPSNPKAVMSLVHGFGEHCRRYADMADFLRMQDIAVVAIDLRGHGQSDGKRGVCRDYGHLREDVEALVEYSAQRFPGLPHILYGHSMGGGLVMNYILHGAKGGRQNVAQGLRQEQTVASKFSAIIASAPLLKLADPVPSPLEFIVRVLRKITPNLSLSQPISGEKVSTLSEEKTAYEADPLNHGRLGVGLAVDMVEAGEWVLSHASEWALPLLLMHARGDRLTDFSGSAAFASKAQNCQFIPFENVEHEIHNDKCRAEVYTAMGDFINGHI